MRSALNPRAWALAAVLAAAATSAQAQAASEVSVYGEEHKRVRGSESVDALGPNLFGDKIGLYSGRLEFIQTDVTLPGNNALPVGISRRLSTGGRDILLDQTPFADWDLEIPHLHGVFASGPNDFGWAVGDYPPDYFKRCSLYGSPPIGRPLNGSSIVIWEPEEYWFGNSLYVPGDGDQEILIRASGNVLKPSDGASYPLVTKSGWQLGCLPSLANGKTYGKAQGEGFVALAPDGTRWYFDQFAQRGTTSLSKPSPGAGSALRFDTASSAFVGGADASASGRATGPITNVVSSSKVLLGRDQVWLLPTRAVDRHGNTLTFTYDPADDWKLTRIAASDGRTLTLTHDGTSRRIRTVSDGTRTWTYNYAYTLGQMVLASITLPDASTWTFGNTTQAKHTTAKYQYNPSCTTPGTPVPEVQTLTMTHPSGAVGSFTLQSMIHGRTDVPKRCSFAGDKQIAWFPMYFGDRSITAKTLSGPGLPTSTWSYAYSAPTPSWAPCGAGCTPTKTVTVTDPRGMVTRHTFGTRFANNEGQLLKLEEGVSGSTALRTTNYRYRSPTAGPYPAPVGTNPDQRNDHFAGMHHQPQDRRVVTQQGVDFTWEATAYDVHARPTTVTKSSTLGPTRTETTAYFDHLGKWILGQLASVTETSTGKVVERHEYDTTTAQRTASHAFGLKTAGFTYHPDGTLHVRTDRANRPTTHTNYKRGLPQNVAYPDGSSESAVINDIGLISSHTNPAGTTTAYGYDAMGRLARINPPDEPGLVYNDTTLAFEKVAAIEYGLPAGHWRQTVSTGNARTIRYFDALWRPVLERTFDAANEPATRRVVQTRWDIDNRKTFASYPQRDIAAYNTSVAGHAWAFDALGRETKHFQDSELGLLTTTTDYLTSFRRKVTNPRNAVTEYGYQAFDSPSEDALTAIWAPEGATTSIWRDVFGKATAIQRSGSYGGTSVSATRSYVYDTHQRLCKTIEPETGATVQDYDAAGNIAWKASGLALPSATSCDTTSVPAARKVSHTYDARNRLKDTTYGDGSPGIARTYTPDGLLRTTASAGMTWTYDYFNRRLLNSESLYNAATASTYAFAWGVDVNGKTASLTYGPLNQTVLYSPNALGEPTQVSGYASGVTYHPNGAIAGYTLGNGVAHSLTQNTRGLPLVWRDAGIVQDQYAYDANGNVTAITDLQESGLTSRSLGYDGLDRLKTANGIWGAGSFSYDPLDNLRTSAVGNRSLTHAIDPPTNRLTGLSGSQNIAFGYDANGNVSARGAQSYVFDVGNRLNSAPGKASYVYDGHGRRAWLRFADGSDRIQAYSQGGKLLMSRHSAQGYTLHVYLGDRLIAEEAQVGGRQYAHTDALGSPVARSSGTAPAVVLSRTRYEPYGATAAGTNPTGIGFTGHVNDADTGLVYMQQRYYDPIAGRFLSVDPVVTDTKNGGSFNRYVYAENNPFLYVDPDGRAGFNFSFQRGFSATLFKGDGLSVMGSNGKELQGFGVSFSVGAATTSDGYQLSLSVAGVELEGYGAYVGGGLTVAGGIGEGPAKAGVDTSPIATREVGVMAAGAQATKDSSGGSVSTGGRVGAGVGAYAAKGSGTQTTLATPTTGQMFRYLVSAVNSLFNGKSDSMPNSSDDKKVESQ